MQQCSIRCFTNDRCYRLSSRVSMDLIQNESFKNMFLLVFFDLLCRQIFIISYTQQAIDSIKLSIFLFCRLYVIYPFRTIPRKTMEKTRSFVTIRLRYLLLRNKCKFFSFFISIRYFQLKRHQSDKMLFFFTISFR